MPVQRPAPAPDAPPQARAPVAPSRPLLTLLQAAGQGRADLPLAAFTGDQVRWAIAAGLGPWLARCTAAHPGTPDAALWPLVRAADLTARVLVGEQLDALQEILDDCAPHLPPFTLLKGISACGQLYPEAHLRIMGDIDLLVNPSDAEAVQARLRALGYRPQSTMPPTFYDTHHHLRPMFHPERRVWVEVHRGLLPPSFPVSGEPLFRRDRVQAQLVTSTFRGRPVQRLGEGLQLLYTAAHWAAGTQPGRRITGILDAMHLLQRDNGAPWLPLLMDRDAPRATAYTYVLLTYLHRRALAPVAPEALAAMASRQRTFGPVTLRAFHALVDRFVVEGQPFGGLVSDRTFERAWAALLEPGPPMRNVLTLAWRLLPSRTRIARALGRATTPPSAG